MNKDEMKTRLICLLHEGYKSFAVGYDDDSRSQLMAHPATTDPEKQADYLADVVLFCIESVAYFSKKPEKSVVSIFPWVS